MDQMTIGVFKHVFWRVTNLKVSELTMMRPIEVNCYSGLPEPEPRFLHRAFPTDRLA